MATCLIILILFNLFFFHRLWANPFEMATSELLSTFFPTWINGGKRDNYWLNPKCHPVLSRFYPMVWCQKLLEKASLDVAFHILVRTLLFHFMFCSLGWYILLSRTFSPRVAIFGALTFTYQAMHLRQQPCLVYTIAWFPWIGIVPGLAIGMMLLAGYYPYALYLLPLGLFLCQDPMQWLLGLAIGAVQIIPFLRYLPKTIRKGATGGGSVPWERSWYFGLIPIYFAFLSPWWPVCLLPVVLSRFKNFLPRVPERIWIVSSYSLIFVSLVSLQQLVSLEGGQKLVTILLILQAFDLWLHNGDLLPPRPYCELSKKPSSWYKKPLIKYLRENLDKGARVSGLPFPFFTGHLIPAKTLGYCGSMQLKLMAKFRNDKNPHGSGHHDWFVDNEDGEAVDRARIQFAFTRKKLDWERTEIRHLWRNPRYAFNAGN
jgi:hypothetical protein